MDVDRETKTWRKYENKEKLELKIKSNKIVLRKNIKHKKKIIFIG